MARELTARGAQVAGEDEAQAIVVNTCAVTAEAEAKARKAVRHAAGLPAAPVVVATGCVASLFADELEALAPNVSVEADKAKVAEHVMAELGFVGEMKVGAASAGAAASGAGGSQVEAAAAPGLDAGDAGARASEPSAELSSAGRAAAATTSAASSQDANPASEPGAPGHAVTPTGRMRPGLKIQDGCDNRCTYCIVWKARGSARSIKPKDVLAGVDALVADGAKEVVLTGIDLGRYEYEGLTLAGLLRQILDKTNVGRVRLSSIEPAGVTPELLEVMAVSHGRVAPYLHIPLQSGCDVTLERMGRPYTSAEYLEVVARAREALPGVAIACDLIVGFPQETDEEFAQSLATCEAATFAKMHVFRYSRRPGTPAAAMAGQVPSEVSSERSRAMRELASRMRAAYAESLVGTEQLVLVERNDTGVTGGLVETLVDEGLCGQLVRVVPRAVTAADVLDARGCRIMDA